MSVLYRKYRPQSFKEMIGQNHIKITLQNQIANGEIGHAYLFCGPRGLGKTTAARILAKAINCENRKANDGEPCNKCASCEDIIHNRSIDIIEIDAASHTSVDNVRENIIENSRFTPSKSKFKVFIIDEVHMLSNAAFNALLKTLEEPPAHVIFILCTTEIHKLPQTIISRCQRFDFKKVLSQDMMDLLKAVAKDEKKKIEDEVLKSIVLHSEGCVRDALSLLGKIFSLGDDIKMEQAEIILPRANYGAITEFIGYILEKNSTAGVELINRLVEEGVDLSIFTENLLEMLRKVMLVKVNSNLADFGIELDEETFKKINIYSERFSMTDLISAIELFTQALQDLKNTTIYQLPLEIATIKLAGDVVCKKDDDFFQGGGSAKSETEVKAKKVEAKAEVEEKIIESAVEIEAVKEEVKVDLLSKEDKLKPTNFADMGKIKENWNKVVEALLDKNFTLSSLLKISQPLKCKDGVLEVAVKSTFYKDRMESSSNRKIIEDTLSEHVMAQISIKGIVCEDLVIPELKEESGNKPVFGSDVSSYKSEPIAKPPASADVVADVMSMF